MRDVLELIYIGCVIGAIVCELMWITAAWQRAERRLTTSVMRANASESFVVYEPIHANRNWHLVLQYPECTLYDFYTTRHSAQQALQRAITTNETIYHTPDCWVDVDFAPDCMTADQWNECRRHKNAQIAGWMVFIGAAMFVIEFGVAIGLGAAIADRLDGPPHYTPLPTTDVELVRVVDASPATATESATESATKLEIAIPVSQAA